MGTVVDPAPWDSLPKAPDQELGSYSPSSGAGRKGLGSFSWGMGLKEMPGGHRNVFRFLKGFFEPHFQGVWSLPASASRSISVHVSPGHELEDPGRHREWPQKASSTRVGGLSALTVPLTVPMSPGTEAFAGHDPAVSLCCALRTGVPLL